MLELTFVVAGHPYTIIIKHASWCLYIVSDQSKWTVNKEKQDSGCTINCHPYHTGTHYCI